MAEVHPVEPQRMYPVNRLAPGGRIACITGRQISLIGFQIQLGLYAASPIGEAAQRILVVAGTFPNAFLR